MPSTPLWTASPRWYLIPARVVLVSFLLTLLSFAVSLLLGILGLAILGRLRGIHPNMTLAYRHVALPTAIMVGAVALIAMAAVEVRNYRQSKALAEIAQHSR
jgi:hypothetical protein